MVKLSEKRFAIFGWTSPPPSGSYGNEKAFNTLEYYKKVKDCGIDFVMDTYDRYRPDISSANLCDGLESAKNAQKAGVKYLVADGGLSGLNDKTKVKKYCDEILEAGAFGHNAYDEPGMPGADMRAVDEIYQDLRVIKDEYNRLYPNKMFYVNHLPHQCYPSKNYWNTFEDSTRKEYEEDYIENFIKIVKPEFISFDMYNLENIIAGDINVLTNEDKILPSKIWVGRLENLEVFAHLSQKYGIEFYTFVQVAEHWAGVKKHIRYPFYEDIKFQLSSQLAYGCAGVEYFTYFQVGSAPHYGKGCIDKDGNTTEHYHDVARLNRELQVLAPYYFAYKCVGTMVNLGINNKSNPDFDLLQYNLLTYDLLQNIETSQDTLIGIFESGADNGVKEVGLLITNYTDPQNHFEDNVRIAFSKNIKRVKVFDNEKVVDIEILNNVFEYSLKSGEYIFVMIE